MIRTGKASSPFLPTNEFSAPPQMDYTEAGTCDKCFGKRKDVSLAGEPCSCTVTFAVEKMFKVRWRFSQRANKRRILYKTQTSLVFVATLSLQGDVFVYYGLKNFHQNLRRYMDSRDDTQTAGRKRNLKVAPTKHIHLQYILSSSPQTLFWSL